MFKSNFSKFSFYTALGLLFFGVHPSPLNAETLLIGRNLATDPLLVTGQSGGSVESDDCGFIGQEPHHVLRVTERVNYLRVTLKADQGEPTLLVDGPDGRFCVVADSLSPDHPEISGVWLPGDHKIYVGDSTEGGNQFTLEISQTD